MAQSTLESRFAVPQDQSDEEDKPDDTNTVYSYYDVDIYPYYNDGIEEFYKLFSQKLWVPTDARKKANFIDISIKFIVEKDGRLNEIDCKVSSIGPRVTEVLREEIIKAMKKMPNWVPGKADGKYVRVKVIIPYSLSVKERQ